MLILIDKKQKKDLFKWNFNKRKVPLYEQMTGEYFPGNE